MKRALLIAGGTLGGLGAVMAITPPQFSTSNTAGIGAGLGAIGGSTAAATSTPTASASATKSATSTPSATNKPKATKSATAKATTQATATAAASAPAPATKGVSGVFSGPTINVNYGNVQVEITVSNGKITDAKALQAPSGRSQRWTDMATPILRQQTLAAQSASIQGASGASYTSYGWFKSLQGALSKAGL
jgi:uncharacterized protein with FMN-binding domain